eukprot:284816643_6
MVRIMSTDILRQHYATPPEDPQSRPPRAHESALRLSTDPGHRLFTYLRGQQHSPPRYDSLSTLPVYVRQVWPCESCQDMAAVTINWLGVELNSNLTWTPEVQHRIRKTKEAGAALKEIMKMKFIPLPDDIRRNITESIVCCHLSAGVNILDFSDEDQRLLTNEYVRSLLLFTSLSESTAKEYALQALRQVKHPPEPDGKYSRAKTSQRFLRHPSLLQLLSKWTSGRSTSLLFRRSVNGADYVLNRHTSPTLRNTARRPTKSAPSAKCIVKVVNGPWIAQAILDISAWTTTLPPKVFPVHTASLCTASLALRIMSRHGSRDYQLAGCGVELQSDMDTGGAAPNTEDGGWCCTEGDHEDEVHSTAGYQAHHEHCLLSPISRCQYTFQRPAAFDEIRQEFTALHVAIRKYREGICPPGAPSSEAPPQNQTENIPEPRQASASCGIPLCSNSANGRPEEVHRCSSGGAMVRIMSTDILRQHYATPPEDPQSRPPRAHESALRLSTDPGHRLFAYLRGQQHSPPRYDSLSTLPVYVRQVWPCESCQDMHEDIFCPGFFLCLRFFLETAHRKTAPHREKLTTRSNREVKQIFAFSSPRRFSSPSFLTRVDSEPPDELIDDTDTQNSALGVKNDNVATHNVQPTGPGPVTVPGEKVLGQSGGNSRRQKKLSAATPKVPSDGAAPPPRKRAREDISETVRLLNTVRVDVADVCQRREDMAALKAAMQKMAEAMSQIVTMVEEVTTKVQPTPVFAPAKRKASVDVPKKEAATQTVTTQKETLQKAAQKASPVTRQGNAQATQPAPSYRDVVARRTIGHKKDTVTVATPQEILDEEDALSRCPPAPVSGGVVLPHQMGPLALRTASSVFGNSRRIVPRPSHQVQRDQVPSVVQGGWRRCRSHPARYSECQYHQSVRQEVLSLHVSKMTVKKNVVTKTQKFVLLDLSVWSVSPCVGRFFYGQSLGKTSDIRGKNLGRTRCLTTRACLDMIRKAKLAVHRLAVWTGNHTLGGSVVVHADVPRVACAIQGPLTTFTMHFHALGADFVGLLAV